MLMPTHMQQLQTHVMMWTRNYVNVFRMERGIVTSHGLEESRKATPGAWRRWIALKESWC